MSHMSTSTILAILAALCGWQVSIECRLVKEIKEVKKVFDCVANWMEEQEKINAEFRLWTTALEGQYRELSERLDALETRLPEFDWEKPNAPQE